MKMEMKLLTWNKHQTLMEQYYLSKLCALNYIERKTNIIDGLVRKRESENHL